MMRTPTQLRANGARPPRRAQPAARGFTLVELMAALTGSLFFTIFVFMLSRDVSRFFDGQVRTSDTMLRTITGFERLRNDIVRAGFLASPNLARDVNRCPRPVPGNAAQAPEQVGSEWSSANLDGLRQMALLRIETSENTQVTANYMVQNNAGGLEPEVLTLYGNYTSAEQFPVRTVRFGGAATQLLFEVDSPAMTRVGVISTVADSIAVPLLRSIFRAGQIVRVVDETGREQYGLVDASTLPTIETINGERVPVVTLDTSVNLIRKQSADGALCGIRGAAAGLAANPVDIVRYELVDVANDIGNHEHLTYLFEGAAPAYDGTRLDLMRYRVSPTVGSGDQVPDADKATGELIAEYATDLRFGLTVLSDAASGVITYLPEGDARIENYAGNPTDTGTAGQAIPAARDTTYGPHFIRGVRARLNVRYRMADRDTPILVNPDAAASEQIFRVELDDQGTFARTRTLRSHVATRNTQNLLWN